MSLACTDAATPRFDDGPVVCERGWAGIHDPDTPLLLLPMRPPCGAWVEALLADAPFDWRGEADAALLSEAIPNLPAELRTIVREKAMPFSRLMRAGRLSVRVEGIIGNACTRLHADYTDVRLIRTLAGPGTDYALRESEPDELARVPTGWAGLFKGCLYRGRDGTVHRPCLHRSPPIDSTGKKRLLLVIDTVRG